MRGIFLARTNIQLKVIMFRLMEWYWQGKTVALRRRPVPLPLRQRKRLSCRYL